MPLGGRSAGIQGYEEGVTSIRGQIKAQMPYMDNGPKNQNDAKQILES